MLLNDAADMLMFLGYLIHFFKFCFILLIYLLFSGFLFLSDQEIAHAFIWKQENTRKHASGKDIDSGFIMIRSFWFLIPRTRDR